jgi:hypothetical protein
VVIALIVSSFAILHSSLFSARRVTVSGAVHESRNDVLTAAKLTGRPPLIEVNSGAAANGVERLPWVARATVARHWPSSVTISIVERVPVGAARKARGGALLVDGTGRVLGSTATPPPGLVLLNNLGRLPRVGDTLVSTGGEVAALADAIPPSIRPRVLAVGWTKREGLTLTLVPASASGSGSSHSKAGGPQVLIGSRRELRAKFVALATLLDPVGNRQAAVVASARTIDLRVATAPVVTPVSSSSTPSPTTTTVPSGAANGATTTTIAPA